jgi:hypothetical protein
MVQATAVAGGRRSSCEILEGPRMVDGGSDYFSNGGDLTESADLGRRKYGKVKFFLSEVRGQRSEVGGRGKRLKTARRKTQYPNTQTPKYPNTQMPKCPNAQVPKCPNTQIPKYPNTQIPKCPNTQVPKCPNAQMPKYPNAKCPNTQIPNSLPQSPFVMGGEGKIGLAAVLSRFIGWGARTPTLRAAFRWPAPPRSPRWCE